MCPECGVPSTWSIVLLPSQIHRIKYARLALLLLSIGIGSYLCKTYILGSLIVYGVLAQPSLVIDCTSWLLASEMSYVLSLFGAAILSIQARRKSDPQIRVHILIVLIAAIGIGLWISVESLRTWAFDRLMLEGAPFGMGVEAALEALFTLPWPFALIALSTCAARAVEATVKQLPGSRTAVSVRRTRQMFNLLGGWMIACLVIVATPTLVIGESRIAHDSATGGIILRCTRSFWFSGTHAAMLLSMIFWLCLYNHLRKTERALDGRVSK